VQAKALLEPNGSQTAAAVGTGAAELGVTYVTEMMPDSRIEIVGPLPEAIQSPLLFGGGVASTSADPKTARAFITFATSARP
jgi:molybdate transport system substrate-binding protein